MNRLVYVRPVTIEVAEGLHQVTAALFRSGGNLHSTATGSYVVKNVVIRGSSQTLNRVDHALLLAEVRYQIAQHISAYPYRLHFADVKFHGMHLLVDARKPLKRNICFDKCDLYVQGLRNGRYGVAHFGFRHTTIRNCVIRGVLVHPDGSRHEIPSDLLKVFARYSPHKLRLEGTNG